MVNYYALLRPIWLLSICDFDRRCTEYEAYLSTQPPSPQQGSRFPYENGYFQWPQGACPPSCKGPQGSVRLMKFLGNQQKHEHRSKQNGSDSRAIICFALLPFYLSYGSYGKMNVDDGFFSALRHNHPLKYTKYFCSLIACSAKNSLAVTYPFSHCEPPRV